MTPQCGRSVVQVLVVKVDIEVVTYEAMTPQCGRSVVQVLVVRVDIGVVTYEAMTPQCGRSVVQVLVVRVDIEVVIIENIDEAAYFQITTPNSTKPSGPEQQASKYFSIIYDISMRLVLS